LNGVPDTYNFHLIFKGLFRCVPDRQNNSLAVLLVDARSPQRNSAGEPLRDHRAAIEFYTKDWRNSTPEPLRNFVEVTKRNKEPVGIYLLNRHDVKIGLSHGTLSPGLAFIEDNSATSFLRLPRIEDIAPGSARIRPEALASGNNCIARVLDLKHGIVRSERPSTFEGNELRWAFSLPRERSMLRVLRTADTEERARLIQELANTARVINLDVRVTAQVPAGASVIIDPTPFPNDAPVVDPPAFMLRPEGKDLEVWIKNRELEVILTESDREGMEEGCQGELVDFDWELQYNLSAETPDRRIPYRIDALNGDVAGGGCACGGCSGGGG
jgi:hypothetical protein